MNKSWIAFSAMCVVTNATALEVQLFHPTNQVDSGVVVQGSSGLKQKEVQLGVGMNFLKNPLEFTSRGTTTDPRLTDLVDWALTTDLLISAGVFDWLTLTADVPIHYTRLKRLSTFERHHETALGDIRIGGLIPLRTKTVGDNYQLGFALAPFITIPTGKEEDFLGNENVTGGLSLVMDGYIGAKNYLAMNAGFRGREREDIVNLHINHEFTGSIGYTRTLAEAQRVFAFLEMFGSTTSRHFLTQEVSSPAEFIGGFQKKWQDDHLVLKIGAGRGMNNGYGAPDYRVFGFLSYALNTAPAPTPVPSVTPTPEPTIVPTATPTPMPEPTVVPTVTPTPQEKIEFKGKILFDAGKANLKAESFPVLNEVIAILQNHPNISQVRIEAHTDNTSTHAFNQTLSDRRAVAVKKFMVEKGIDPARLTTQGFAETKPLVPNDTPTNRALNRRVEFVIVQKTIENSAP